MKKIHTDQAPAAVGPYSQAIAANGFLFISGQIALDPKSGALLGKTVSEQAEIICQNIKAILKAAGLDIEAVVKTTCFLTDMATFSEFNQVYAKHFTGAPARSCVASPSLPKDALCEIETIAAFPQA
jgi:2-iminobutanoate/2-iminopropanoate deaminase